MVFVIITACENCKLANSNDYLRSAAKQFLVHARPRFLAPKIILKKGASGTVRRVYEGVNELNAG